MGEQLIAGLQYPVVSGRIRTYPVVSGRVWGRIRRAVSGRIRTYPVVSGRISIRPYQAVSGRIRTCVGGAYQAVWERITSCGGLRIRTYQSAGSRVTYQDVSGTCANHGRINAVSRQYQFLVRIHISICNFLRRVLIRPDTS